MSDWKSRAKPVSNDWKSRARQVSVDIPTINERTPYVSVGDRAIAKNLAQSPEKQAEFLKKKYPDLEVKVANSDVVVRKPGEQNFKKLDPSTLELEDITDLGDAVVGGITSTLGTAAGALGGALAGGVGALPGAVAGSALAGAGTEALRQKLGQALGIPQDVSMGDVATQAVLGGAGTALLGTGPALKTAVKQLAASKGITEEAAKAALESSGGIAAAYKNVPSKMAEYWFGAPSDVIKKYANETQAIDDIASGSKTDFARNLVDRIRLGLNQEKQKVGGMLSDEIGQSGASIDFGPIRRQYMQHIGKLKEEYDQLPNAINKAKVNAAVAEFDAIFRNQKVNDKVFKEVTEGGKFLGVKPVEEILSGTQVPGGIPLSKASQKALDQNARNTVKFSPMGKFEQKLNNALTNFANPPVPYTPPVDQPVDIVLKGFEETYSPLVTQTKLMTALEAKPGMNQFIPDKITPMQAWKLQDVFKEYGDLTRIGSGVNSRFKNQATQAERELSDQALSAYQQLNKSLDEATSGASQALKDEYSDLKRIQAGISPYLNTDQSAYTTFKNSDSGAKTAFRESIEKLSQKTGENYKDDMLNLQAAEYFGSNALTPRSVGGVTSTSRTVPATVAGSILGSSLGGTLLGPMGAYGGAAVGGAAGNLLASPLALKAAIKASAPIRQGVNAMSPYLFNSSPVLRETINQTRWSEF